MKQILLTEKEKLFRVLWFNGLVNEGMKSVLKPRWAHKC